VSNIGRGGRPDGWSGQGAPGHGPQAPPPYRGGGSGYGPGGYQGQPGYPGQQGHDPPQGQQYAGPQLSWPGGLQPTATMSGGPPPGSWGGGPPSPLPGYGAPPRRRGRIAIAIVAVVALAAGAFGVVTWLSGRGGADSPAAAVRLLAEDVAAENLIDAVSRLHPAEAGLFADAGDVLVDELVRLEVLKPRADLDLGSFTINDLQLDEGAAEEVRDDIVINKVVGGSIVMERGFSDLPFTDGFARTAFPDGRVPTTSEPATWNIADLVGQAGEPLRLASVQVDGEWYVSLLYTAADYGLRSEGKAWPAQAVPAVGADTAEDAVQQTLEAFANQDTRRMIELMDPAELQVLHDTGEALIEEAGGTLSEAELLLETTESTVRGHPALQLSRAVIEADGSRSTIDRDGDCLVTTEDGGAAQRLCSTDVLESLGDSADPTLQRLAPKLVQAALDMQIVTNQVDGKYYVSPGQTVISLFGSALGVLEPQDVTALLDAATEQ